MSIHLVGGKIPPKMVLEFTLFEQVKIRDPTPQEKKDQELLDQLSTLRNEDEWWFWKRIGVKDSLNRFQLKLGKQQMDAYLNSFKEVFDNEWWSCACKKQRKSIASDPLGAFGGQCPILRILRLGECIHHMGGKKKLPLELIKRLMNKRTFWAAATELEIATCFNQAGFRLEMYPPIPSGSKPDGKVIIDGKDLFYEVTEQHWSSYETDIQHSKNRIIDWLSRNCEPMTGSIEFISGKDKPDSTIGELLNLFKSHYDYTTRMLDQLPFVFENEDFKIHLDTANKNGGWVSINGLEPKPEIIVRNWVNQLFKKSKQLPAGKSGVIIGGPLFLWGPDEVRYAYDEVHKKLAGASHTRISGIILCAKHVENSGFIKHVPSIIINSNAKMDNVERIKMMAQALFEFPD